MTTVSADRLAQTFVEVADTLVDGFDVTGFLRMLADRTAALVDACAVGLLLADQHGRLEFSAASEEPAKVLELFQVRTGQGPCIDAFRTAAPVVIVNLADVVHRWPRFAPRAIEAGFRSVHAFPLRLRSRAIGALNVFGREPGPCLRDADVPIVRALADVAAIGLLQQRAIHHGELLAEQLQGALNSRVVIEQAKGVIAQALGVSVEEAFDLLRGYARTGNHRIADLARAIVANPARISKIAQPSTSKRGGATGRSQQPDP